MKKLAPVLLLLALAGPSLAGGPLYGSSAFPSRIVSGLTCDWNRHGKPVEGLVLCEGFDADEHPAAAILDVDKWRERWSVSLREIEPRRRASWAYDGRSLCAIGPTVLSPRELPAGQALDLPVRCWKARSGRPLLERTVRIIGPCKPLPLVTMLGDFAIVRTLCPDHVERFRIRGKK